MNDHKYQRWEQIRLFPFDKELIENELPFHKRQNTERSKINGKGGEWISLLPMVEFSIEHNEIDMTSFH